MNLKESTEELIGDGVCVLGLVWRETSSSGKEQDN